MDLASFLRDVPDFPKPGILFKDISPMLASPEAMRAVTDRFATLDFGRVDTIAGIESRGFLFGVPLAMQLGVGFIPIRKPGKLPAKTRSVHYDLEYGSDSVEMHEDAVAAGERVLVIDDLLATGGTMAAAAQLVEACGGTVAGCACVIELAFLQARANALAERRCESLVAVG